MTKGIIVGCDQNQEWLLPWWWLNYAYYNTYPVTFVDMGDLSPKAVSWCQMRGSLVKLQSTFQISKKEAIDPKLVSFWEEINPKVWQSRPAWFKKPLAMLQSPYETTIWLDLDCQVRGKLDPLFDFTPFAMAKEVAFFQNLDEKRGLKHPQEEVYNSAVIVFEKENEILKGWVKAIDEKNSILMGDQQVLSRHLFEEKKKIKVLPNLYNWRIDIGYNKEALIIHWLGRFHENIKRQIEGMKVFLNIRPLA
jgi:hypothetical protein